MANKNLATAEIVRHGQGQAVQLPEGVSFDDTVTRVVVSRENDRLVLTPVPRDEWPVSFWQALEEGLPDDFERPAAVPQLRDDLDP